jgi:uncharacterized ferredoxin-like protein
MCPPIVQSRDGEMDATLQAAGLMMVAARTAPKTAGVDDVLTLIVYGPEKNAIAERMEKISDERKIKEFRRDAKNVRDSAAVVLVGVRGGKSLGLDCGGCGHDSCREFDAGKKKLGKDFAGPNCIFKLLDLGIALGSAAKTAGTLNIDNRMMYRVGVAVQTLGLLPEATVVIGIPVSTMGKSIYFDRPLKV